MSDFKKILPFGAVIYLYGQQDRRTDMRLLIGVFGDCVKSLKQLGSSVRCIRKKRSCLNPAPA
jgi:hypothetical protein